MSAMILGGVVASSIPFLALYAWAFYFARRNQSARPTAARAATRAIAVLVVGELVRVFLTYQRMVAPIADDSPQAVIGSNLLNGVLLAGFPLVGTYLLVRAIFAPPTDV
jgi:hypothetical protein